MGAITVDTRDRKPIHEQLTDNIQDLVLRGVLKPDEQLPGVRSLAVELTINPNTIAKSYAELERRGIIYTLQGRGSFVSDNVSELCRMQREKMLNELEAAMRSARSAGVEKDEALKIFDKIWGEQN